ncbi:MAG TPA: helix-turn-helix domain-containing protein [Cellvibrionaceae bacterium]
MTQHLSLSPAAASYLQCLGLNIKDARKARKWSQAEVAERALMSRLTYAQIEKGAPQVQMGLYLRVLDLFGLAEPIRHIAAPHLDEEGRRLRASKNKAR